MHHLIVAATSYAAIKLKKTKKKSSKIGRRVVRRTRKSVIQVHNELGQDVFRRAYRMHLETFLNLYSIVKEDLLQVMKYNDICKRGPNGRVHPSVVLACALRVFSGGDSYDLITTFGISKCNDDLDVGMDGGVLLSLLLMLLGCCAIGIFFYQKYQLFL